jgi:uncharacterized protein DUF222
MDTVRAGLPAGLEDMPPGPALATALSTVDRTELTGCQLAIVVAAQGRQVAHEQARLLADAVELGRIPWHGLGPVTREHSDEFSADQIAMTLTISRWAAAKLQDLGEYLLTGLPTVYQALLDGRIDYPRAMAFHEILALLEVDKAQTIAELILPKAAGWTSGQLRDRLHYQAHKADPNLARRRYRAGVTDRRVYLGLNHDGTAHLSGTNLPVDRAAAAEDRLDRLARAAKADGDTRTLDQLRADALLDTLTGIPFRLRPSTDPATAAADREAAATIGTHAAAHRDADTAASGLDAQESNDLGEPAGPDARICACGGVRPAQRRGVVDITVPLSTLIGLTDNPGLIPGWGPVLADIARQVALDQAANPTWKWSVTDEHGHLLHHGHTTRRPTATEADFVRARDRTCRAPGCRKPAIRCDHDHRRDHHHGGPSHRGNICTECRHHHRLKHERNFRIHTIGSGGFFWEAPDGRLYYVPADGNIVAISEATDTGGWDLDQAHPPRPVRQIIPRSA